MRKRLANELKVCFKARINSKQSITWFSSLENTRHAVFLVLLLLSACAWLTAMSTQTEGERSHSSHSDCTLTRDVPQDTLLAIRYLGIQLSHRKYIAVGSLFKIPVSSSTVFIPLESVKDILMLEGIRGWSVVFYLAIVQEIGGSMQIHVAFPVRSDVILPEGAIKTEDFLQHLMPRLHILRAVYSGARAVVNGSQQTTAADTPV